MPLGLSVVARNMGKSTGAACCAMYGPIGMF